MAEVLLELLQYSGSGHYAKGGSKGDGEGAGGRAVMVVRLRDRERAAVAALDVQRRVRNGTRVDRLVTYHGGIH